MNLTATKHVWSQNNCTVYEDEQGRYWIAYTHELVNGRKRGCYCRIIRHDTKHDCSINNWVVAFGNKDDRNYFVPYGDKNTKITLNGIKPKDCFDYVTLHAVEGLIENYA